MAIAALQHQAPEQAIPMLGKLLAGTASPKLKERALFVLAQSNSAQAREVLKGIAKGNSTPELQSRAISYLGNHGGPESRAILAEVYSSTSDIDMKKRILSAFAQSGEKDRLVAAANGEQNAELRATAVQQLGNMGAHDELWALYQKGELRPDSVLTGEFTFDPTAANVDEVLMQIEEARREAEIVRLIGGGISNKEIARRLRERHCGVLASASDVLGKRIPYGAVATGSKIVFRGRTLTPGPELDRYSLLLKDGLWQPTSLEIFVMNRDGSDMRQVTNASAALLYSVALAASPLATACSRICWVM